MIKCPECGRQISDKAPYCPNCGVAIAGKIIRCPQCGEIYFKDQEMCPNCHHLTSAMPQGESRLSGQVGNSQEDQQAHTSPQTEKPVPPTPPTPPRRQQRTPIQTPPTPPSQKDSNAGQTPKKKSHTAIIIGILLAIVVCGACFYFYNNAKSNKEQDAYEFAMKSDDPLVLQTYLDNYKDAPVEHIDSIEAHLEALKQIDTDWNNAVVSGSKQALLEYLSKYPNSEHKAVALHKIDSLDWVEASNQNTLDALQAYLSDHANGEYVDQANDAIKLLKAKTVQPEEKTLVSSVLRHFFQAINSKSESSLEATVAPLMSNFLGKQDATKADVVTFMDKIYKDDITNMNWHVGNDMKIDKKEVGDEQYQYTVSFSASQDIERTDPDKEKHANYKITAVINPDGLITAMTMTKILE